MFAWLAVLLLLGVQTPAPVVVVQNERGENVRLFDGTFSLGRPLMPGEVRTVSLPGRGARALIVRGLGWESRTSVERFEANARWSLTVQLDGSLFLTLATRSPR